MKKSTSFLASFRDNVKAFFSSPVSYRKKKQELGSKPVPKIVEPMLAPDSCKYQPFSYPKFRFWGLLVVLIGFLLFKAMDMVYLLITAIIISISVEVFILSLQRRTGKRGLGIFIVYFILILLLLSGIVFIVPLIISQVSEVFSMFATRALKMRGLIMEHTIQELITQATRIPSLFKEFLLAPESGVVKMDIKTHLLAFINTILEFSSSYIKSISSGVFSFIGNFFVALGRIILVFTLAIFISAEKDGLINLFIKKVPTPKQEKLNKKISRIYSQLGLRLKSRFLMSLFVFLATLISLLILRLFGVQIPNIFSISLLIGLLDIVPYVGPFMGLVPLAILARVHNSFWVMLLVIGIFSLIQQVESNIIMPLLINKQLGVKATMVFVCMIFGGVTMGLWGVILGVPFAVLLNLFLDDNEKKDPDTSLL